MRTGGGGARHHVHLIFEIVPQGGRVVIVQVPVDAVETDMRARATRVSGVASQ